jgi:hypothetical protein
MKQRLFILAHEGTEETLEEFAPCWAKVDPDWQLIFPHGSKSNSFGPWFVGPSAYKGRDILLRFWLTLKEIAAHAGDNEQIIIAEYDTLQINGKPIDFNPSAINAACVMLASPDGKPLLNQVCMLSPWVVTPAMIRALIYATDPHRYKVADWTLGLLDRMIGECCVKANLPLANIKNAVGYAPGEDALRFARAVARTNSDWVHGGKSLAEFNL